ncbi:putative galactose oxidase/kelch, beta-propeller, F-box associated interaction [Helianthus annuus]|uniref:F-box protein At3g08750-like n=1 Tax=Helianthus annuus TaxID=4232 RepID=UPI000B8F7FC6|nr:F-box protein At3g08750-like [Helianthus annuus]KAJ0638441.1 putative galactose oxidase/kelch, beta-propeller, F-box associated interaction [Helianthus annuus]KAJ0689462.1 putative galactose oxidase/kelch, beta-propeller, F-box associated interaction [Helianthus annuus]
MLDIIARLPPLAVAKCKTVSKKWLAYISKPEFLRVHCHFMRASPDQKILTVGNPSLCLVRSLNFADANYFLATDVPTPFNVRPRNLLFLASLDGMLCVCLKNTCELLLWNPLTRACKILSNSIKQGFYKVQHDAIGFYVDSSFDYNIVHIKRRRGTIAVYIYSLRLGSWKSVRFLKKRPYHGQTYSWSSATFSGDGLYFRVSQYWLAGHKMIIRFDVNTKQFSELPFPNASGEGPNGALVSIRSELHMFVASGYYERPVDLWKLHNGSWMLLCSFPFRRCLPFPEITSITYLNLKDSCLMITEWGQVIEFDLHLDEWDFFSPATFGRIIHGSVYTETILSPGF